MRSLLVDTIVTWLCDRGLVLCAGLSGHKHASRAMKTGVGHILLRDGILVMSECTQHWRFVDFLCQIGPWHRPRLPMLLALPIADAEKLSTDETRTLSDVDVELTRAATIVLDVIDDEMLWYSNHSLVGLSMTLRQKLGSTVELGWEDGEAMGGAP